MALQKNIAKVSKTRHPRSKDRQSFYLWTIEIKSMQSPCMSSKFSSRANRYQKMYASIFKCILSLLLKSLVNLNGVWKHIIIKLAVKNYIKHQVEIILISHDFANNKCSNFVSRKIKFHNQKPNLESMP